MKKMASNPYGHGSSPMPSNMPQQRFGPHSQQPGPGMRQYPPSNFPESTKTATTTSSSSSTAGSSTSKQVPKFPACIASSKDAHKLKPLYVRS
nr:atrophin-1-like [Lytechinus pictus]